MPSEASEIGNRVRGIAAENRFTQERVAEALELSRGSVNARINGSVSFTAAEILRLARLLNAEPARFFPPLHSASSPSDVDAAATVPSGAAAPSGAPEAFPSAPQSGAPEPAGGAA